MGSIGGVVAALWTELWTELWAELLPRRRDWYHTLAWHFGHTVHLAYWLDLLIKASEG